VYPAIAGKKPLFAATRAGTAVIKIEIRTGYIFEDVYHD